MNWFDDYFFALLHGLAQKSAVGDLLIIFFGDYFLYVCLAIVAFFAWRDRKRIRLYGLAVISALIARFAVCEIIRLFYHRLRPFIALGITHLFTDYAYSFPSGHTIFMFALATAIYYFNKKLSYFLFASGLLIGLARVAGGVHYPSDVLGGILLGILTGITIHLLSAKSN